MTKTSPLSQEFADFLESSREWVLGCLTEDDQQYFPELGFKLQVIKALIESGQLGPEHTGQLQALGVVFGDALVQAQTVPFEWAEVEDEYGTEPAVIVPHTSIVVFPLTMISKRIEQGETPEIIELFAATEGRCLDLYEQGNQNAGAI